jgi:PIN domain nuclease of toxin-antitoxin system
LPKYFFDTSALAKVYRQEIGSDFVDRVLSEPGSQHLISRLTIVEMESVLALKVRTGEIDQQAVLIARGIARRVRRDEPRAANFNRDLRPHSEKN